MLMTGAGRGLKSPARGGVGPVSTVAEFDLVVRTAVVVVILFR